MNEQSDKVIKILQLTQEIDQMMSGSSAERSGRHDKIIETLLTIQQMAQELEFKIIEEQVNYLIKKMEIERDEMETIQPTHYHATLQ